jgi:excisionase family DNA binding protein
MNIEYARMHVDARDRELLHVKEAAAELDVHPSTVRRHIHAGDLEAVRLAQHGRYRVARQALEKFLRPSAHASDDTETTT